MRKLTTLFIALCACTLFATAQTTNEKPKLAVTGTALITVKPDLCVLNISVLEVKPTMGAAINALGEKSNHYNSLLKKLGLAESDIKTTGFSVFANKIYRDNNYIDSGYVATQTIRVAFTYSTQTMQKIVTEFAKSAKPIDFNFTFELSEKLRKATQQQALELCIKDATEKANIMANAAKVKLTGVKNMIYGAFGSNVNPTLELKAAYNDIEAGNVTPAFNFTPSDIEFRDSVHVEWSIE
jgi:uncharacterized protein YggE